MSDPSASAGMLGLKIVPGIAGFIGGCLALSFVQGLNRWQAFVTVATGSAAGSYLQPITSHYLGLPAALDGGIGFILGLGGMGLAGLIVKASSDPLGMLEQIKRLRK
ncbi:hypothetical protein [Methyloversatilis discipulorum]|uniref:hypothetical protein n=1 Tax=Methyloversatilis discipulorum TaxID=1119528 RepID=UPI001A5A16A8|nr:hypothetical protein [Methyloversatilis discipulorum]MBL8469631.1 hypothetical protein [Methyloversatilis discipulorum]